MKLSEPYPFGFSAKPKQSTKNGNLNKGNVATQSSPSVVFAGTHLTFILSIGFVLFINAPAAVNARFPRTARWPLWIFVVLHFCQQPRKATWTKSHHMFVAHHCSMFHLIFCTKAAFNRIFSIVQFLSLWKLLLIYLLSPKMTVASHDGDAMCTIFHPAS